MKKVLVIDTSVLCVWLKVPGKETCGPSKALVTYEMVSEKIEEEKKKGTTFILPLATIIETGNHIAHSSGDRKSLGEEFAQIMIDSFQIIGFPVSLGLYHISSFSSSGICTS